MLLAQAGCWVPALRVTLRVVDAVLTRMGASDNILQARCAGGLGGHWACQAAD